MAGSLLPPCSAQTVNGVEIRGQTGPAAALMVAYANASFYECTFASYQDTMFIGRNGSAYLNGGAVKGGTDYLYGFGTLWIEGSVLASRGNGGGITAWKGSTQWCESLFRPFSAPS